MLIHFYNFLERLKSGPAKKNKILLVATSIGLVINLATWAIIYFKFRPLVYHLPADQAFIPLHYNIYLGIDSLGNWKKIFWLPGIGLIIGFINTILALMIFSKKEILSYFLSISFAVIQLFLLVATIITILINI